MRYAVSDIERITALEISCFLQKEYGLPPGHAEARMQHNVLTIRLDHSLTSLGELILRATPDDGAAAIEEFYDTAHEQCHHLLEALVAHIAGAAVPRSSVELDMRTGSLLLKFYFAAA